MKDLLNLIPDVNGMNILEEETHNDYVHLKIISNLSTISQMSSKHLKWNPSCFVATVSENTKEQIRRYIQSRKKK
ncbi:putative transposase [Youngiibacter multivorans]|uniref:Transposase n=1 Tax=Youngiibacter multivorans TaxID=937251 RepID=A0ABS4G5N5_9CLOT|nr:putative transposase [Youngiibacter multivorans]